VVALFERAMDLGIPHDDLALCMMVPSPVLQGSRPVDLRGSADSSILHAVLEQTFTEMAA